jgi:hypothetical protein
MPSPRVMGKHCVDPGNCVVCLHSELRVVAARVAELEAALEPWLCPDCAVATLGVGEQGELWPRCPDCFTALWNGAGSEAASISVGMRALASAALKGGG